MQTIIYTADRHTQYKNTLIYIKAFDFLEGAFKLEIVSFQFLMVHF